MPPTLGRRALAALISRAAVPLPPPIIVEIPRADGRVLRVEDAAALAEVFFATEISSLGPGSYDARTLTTDPERLDREDITVLNRSFRAMIIKTQLWRPLMEAGDLPWLTALGRDWDLVTMPAADWEQLKVVDRIAEAVEAVVLVKGGASPRRPSCCISSGRAWFPSSIRSWLVRSASS
jgi:hypothetical protein